MSCAEFEELILEAIDGQLSPALARHLETCEHCRTFLAAQEEIDRVIMAARAPELSPLFAANVLAHLDDREQVFLRVSFGVELLGWITFAALGAIIVHRWLPMFMVGGPWVAAALILCIGALLTLADPPAPPA